VSFIDLEVRLEVDVDLGLGARTYKPYELKFQTEFVLSVALPTNQPTN